VSPCVERLHKWLRRQRPHNQRNGYHNCQHGRPAKQSAVATQCSLRPFLRSVFCPLNVTLRASRMDGLLDEPSARNKRNQNAFILIRILFLEFPTVSHGTFTALGAGLRGQSKIDQGRLPSKRHATPGEFLGATLSISVQSVPWDHCSRRRPCRCSSGVDCCNGVENRVLDRFWTLERFTTRQFTIPTESPMEKSKVPDGLRQIDVVSAGSCLHRNRDASMLAADASSFVVWHVFCSEGWQCASVLLRRRFKSRWDPPMQTACGNK
jgi:hypothetical protein